MLFYDVNGELGELISVHPYYELGGSLIFPRIDLGKTPQTPLSDVKTEARNSPGLVI